MILVHPPNGQAPTPAYRAETFESLDGLTPPMRRALTRFRRKSTGITPRTIAVAESELLAILKGDNEVIEELDEQGLTREEAAEAAELAARNAQAAATAAAMASTSSTASTSRRDNDGFKRPATPPATPAKSFARVATTTTSTAATTAATTTTAAATTASAATASTMFVPPTPATPATPATPGLFLLSVCALLCVDDLLNIFIYFSCLASVAFCAVQ